MESMTGFSQVKISKKDLSANLQIKSVNSRYLDIKFNLPYELYALEEFFREKIKASFQRGSFDVYISFLKSDTPTSLKSMKPWVKNYQAMAKDLGVKDDLSLSKVLKQMQNINGQALAKQDLKMITESFDKLVLLLKKQRQKEGQALKKVLAKELALATKFNLEVKRKIKSFEAELKKSWKFKLDKLKVDLPKERLAAEAALLMEKADITEEIKRLDVHLKEFKSLIQSKGELLGKKLDFFCQELYRESNTIASKSKSTELTKLSVELKSSIEKIRQQVQNIQ